ncbi:MAG: NAD(P)-binding domain-containing protein, partial [Thermoguttaceae bacterium]
MKRREFIKKSMLTGVSALSAYSLLSNAPSNRVLGQSANDRIGIGIIGAGDMGSGDAHSAARFGDIIAIADADTRQAERLKESFGGKPTVYQDYR